MWVQNKIIHVATSQTNRLRPSNPARRHPDSSRAADVRTPMMAAQLGDCGIVVARGPNACGLQLNRISPCEISRAY